MDICLISWGFENLEVFTVFKNTNSSHSSFKLLQGVTGKNSKFSVPKKETWPARPFNLFQSYLFETWGCVCAHTRLPCTPWTWDQLRRRRLPPAASAAGLWPHWPMTSGWRTSFGWTSLQMPELEIYGKPSGLGLYQNYSIKRCLLWMTVWLMCQQCVRTSSSPELSALIQSTHFCVILICTEYWP